MEKKSRIAIIIVAVIVLGVTIPSIYMLTLNVSGQELYTDSQNRVVVVPNNPQRIISMAPSVTEILYALDVEDRVVGVTDYCDYPSEASQKTSIGGFSTPNLEVIAELDPDLIIAGTYDEEKVQTLSNMGVAIVIVEASTIDEIIDNIDKVGKLINAEAKAKEVTSDLRARVNAITAITSILTDDERVTCYFEIWETPKVAGSASFLNDLIQKAGGSNIFSDLPEEYPSVSSEVIISANPKAIFLTAHSQSWYSQDVCSRTGYNEIDACKNNRVYSVDDGMYLREGPRIVDALEEMAELLHPDLF